MTFADRYINSLNSTSLQDDDLHRQAEPLQASAFSDKSARHIGALLHRVKYSGTMIEKIDKAAEECERLEKLLVQARGEKESADSKIASISSALESVVSGASGFAGEVADFRSLQRKWRQIVSDKGRERNWIKAQDWPKIGHLFPSMVERISANSLAYYLDGNCKTCEGTGQVGARNARTICKTCSGTKRAKVTGYGDYENRLVADMVSELAVLETTHSGVAAARLRKVA